VTASPCLAALTPLAPNASVAPDVVAFESRGVVLVIGDGPAIDASVRALAGALNVVAFAPGYIESGASRASVTAVGGRVVSISGVFGAFRAQAATPGGSADIGKFSPNADGSFDLVLDLSSAPLLSGSVAPLGYFAPGGSQLALADAIAELRRLVGRFVKPKYVDFDASLCTHGAKGLRGCTQCLDVCPAGAIRSVGDLLALDTKLCQGCANCALACPTGALSFNRPSPVALRATLRRLIATARSDGYPTPVIVVHVPAARAAIESARLPARARTLQIEALPAFGEELWFEALAAGAAGVLLIRNKNVTLEEQALLARKIAAACILLDGIAVSPPLGLALVASEALAAIIDAMPQRASVSNDAGERMAADFTGTKRSALLAALDALQTAPGSAMAAVALAPGMHFGEVLVDRAKCTLCFACANLCPTAAFVAELEPVPKLRFIEARCVQCGLCEVGCPERVIKLHRRFMVDATARGEARVLHEDELLCCTECGSPFISRRLLASSLERIKGHRVLGAEGVARLKMCPACRQRTTSIG